ncbi:MAG TPA: hypothetical protein VLE91_03265, partial [Candidatus Saccharimonadales bacterium]|nr:hypothetical protein [Candidatus Saccharimonadales bacterium]
EECEQGGDCAHVCLCGSVECTGTMHLTKEKYKKWREYQDSQQKSTKQPKVYFGKNLQRLRSYPKFIPNEPII